MTTADFASGRLTFDIGKSSTVGNVEGLSGCLKGAFHGAALASLTHEHPRYVVAYAAHFGGVSSSDAELANADKGNDETSSRGEKKVKRAAKSDTNETDSALASVAWHEAPVRSQPKTGDIVAHLPRGARVRVGAARDGWYSVRFGDGFASEGWLHRGAIGR